MKKIIVSIILITIPFLMSSQTGPVEKLFDKYSGEDGYTSIHITSYMFDLFSKVADDEEDKELKEVTSKLESIKILTVDDHSNDQKSVDFFKEVTRSLLKSGCKDLMVIKEGKEEIRFLINEQNEKISELIMVVGGDGETVVMALIGDIDLKEISKLSKSMDIDGLEHLDKVNENKK